MGKLIPPIQIHRDTHEVSVGDVRASPFLIYQKINIETLTKEECVLLGSEIKKAEFCLIFGVTYAT